jgi:uracil phosphoribosyltransferase
MEKVVLNAQALDGYLTSADKANLSSLDTLYKNALDIFPQLSGKNNAEGELIELYNKMGNIMQEICQKTPQLHVYPFLSGQENRPEASRIIAKVRDVQTENHEFVYYIQRAYEMLFKLAWGGACGANKNYLIVKTPVTKPVQNYAVHKIINIDEKIENTFMCVMLRGALLPSMIISKEIEGYSSHGYITPFALFSIKRNESKNENNMEYILDIDRSFFSAEALDGKDLVFADPMNATGGSLITVVKHILSFGIKPRSISFFNVICTLKGALNVVRALDNCNIYTLWMDPALNEDAYIMPGLGDAGDRIIGQDSKNYKRNIIELIADYGSDIAMLYRTQLREIEKTILAGKK